MHVTSDSRLMTDPDSKDTWRKALLSINASLQDAVRSLDNSTLQIALVVTEQGELVGTITDGDIRRGLLKSLTLSSPVDSILRREPMVVPPGFGREMVLQLMQTNRIHQLPVVDESQQVVGLHVLDDLITPQQRPNLMVIMAGGKGTRLMPHTENCPKPLLPVAGKPMLEHIIVRAKAEGFKHFVLAIHYLGDMIEEYFGDGESRGVRIDYIREEAPLGTAGALALLNPRPEIPFIVTNGDVLTDIRYSDLLDFHSHHEALATMAVRLHEWQHPFGIVHTEGIDIARFEEKPVAVSHVNAGVYILEPGALDSLCYGEKCDMPSLFSRIKEQDARTIVYPMHEPWLDVGRPEDYMLAHTLKKDST